MDIDEISAFVAIAQLGGFTRAAARLNRSQPAISRRIGLLEEHLGAQLLERVRGRVELTTAGHTFLPYAEAVLAAIQDGRDAVGASIREGNGSVSLALVGTLADTHIVEVLRKFARRSPVADLELRTANSREVSAFVRRGEVTLGLRYQDDDHPSLSSQIVGEEALLVIAAAGHPLAGRKLQAKDLSSEKWIGFPATRERESFGHVLQRQLIAAGLDPEKVTVIDSLTAQKRLVQAGFGIALMPESSVRDELRLGAVCELRAPMLRTAIKIALLHRRNGYLNPAALALIEMIKSADFRSGCRPRPENL